ncbi:MAG: multidrug ABC transporter permease [Alphaproteobacteria bacterium]|nr:multidrug ABC transporter permease [Alphaproteobacteria bacterium]
MLPSTASLGRCNWLGLWTLYLKEVRRFLKVPAQTVLAPVASTLLFLAIFTLALGGAGRVVGGVPFIAFLGPGLVMMAVLQNAFANTSSSLMIAKMQGSIVDLLMPPLRPGELLLGLALGGLTRGVLCGAVTLLGVQPFAPMWPADMALALFHVVMGSLMMALAGTIIAIWAQKHDQMAAITNFVVTPLAFLSGTFYSVERLPPAFYAASHANPFFYAIDGFRASFIGHADGSLVAGAIVLVAVNLTLGALAHRLLATGYRLKA